MHAPLVRKNIKEKEDEGGGMEGDEWIVWKYILVPVLDAALV